MAREGYGDLLAVARERSFTCATAQLCVSQSALSHTIRALEARLGVRSAPSVAPTEAGEQLFNKLAPRLKDIEADLAEVIELRDLPRGTVCIPATDYTANAVLRSRLAQLMLRYPDIEIEITTDYGLTDIVAERNDIGVRLGNQVAQDMNAVRVGPTCAWQWSPRRRICTRTRRRRIRETSQPITASPPADTKAGRGDNRIQQPEWRPESLKIAQAIARYASDRGTTSVAFSIAWVLKNQLISAAIAGPRTEAHWDSYLKALGVELGPDDEKLVDSLVVPGHASTHGFTDPGYPVEGRKVS